MAFPEMGAANIPLGPRVRKNPCYYLTRRMVFGIPSWHWMQVREQSDSFHWIRISFSQMSFGPTTSGNPQSYRFLARSTRLEGHTTVWRRPPVAGSGIISTCPRNSLVWWEAWCTDGGSPSIVPPPLPPNRWAQLPEVHAQAEMPGFALEGASQVQCVP